MAVKVISHSLTGSLNAPSSKSSMQRAVAAALMANGKSIIYKPSFSDDSLAALGMAESLGAVVIRDVDRIEINGGISPADNNLYCDESGFGLRMFSALAATTDLEIVISGKGSLMRRPVDMIEGPLRKLGATVTTNGGFPPVKIVGPLKGGIVTVDGSMSSQFLSGLLFALPVAREDSTISVTNPTSRPYIDLTIDVLHRFGIEIINKGYSQFLVPGNQTYRPTSYYVEGDWSGASFFLVMAAIGGSITINGLDINSTQADKRIIEIIRQTGAVVRLQNNSVTVTKADLFPFDTDISDCPDLAPPLVVLAAACNGKSTLYGTGRLSIKESSRGHNLANNFNKLGALVTDYGEKIVIEGTGSLMHAEVSSFGDHRMAMASAIGSVISEGGVTIDDTDCINKSYPGFLSDFISTGGSVSS